VNNAGAGVVTPIKDPSIMDSYERFMKLNVRSVVYLTHLAVEYLEKTKGVIINISGIGGLRPVSIYCREKNELFDKNLRHNFHLEFEI
jgi:short-subunit dehydrogenase